MSQKSIIILIASTITVFASVSFASTQVTQNCLPALVISNVSKVTSKDTVSLRLKDELVQIKDELKLPIIQNLRKGVWLASEKTGKPVFYKSCVLTTTTHANNSKTYSTNVQFRFPTKITIEAIQKLKDGKIQIVRKDSVKDGDAMQVLAAINRIRAHDLSIKNSSLKEKLASQPEFSAYKDATVRIDESKDKDVQSVTKDLLHAINHATPASA